jgi:hypothetical protein
LPATEDTVAVRRGQTQDDLRDADNLSFRLAVFRQPWVTDR